MESPKPLRRSRRLAEKRGETVSPSPSPPPPKRPVNTTRRKKANTVKPNTPPVLRSSQRIAKNQRAKEVPSTNNTKKTPTEAPAEVPPGNEIKPIANTTVVPNTAPLAEPRPGYFKDTHIFTLAGHGSAMKPDTYKLKSNEFYTTPTVCGTVRYIPTHKMFVKFVTHRHTIRIPTPTNASFWTGNEATNTSINRMFLNNTGTSVMDTNFYMGPRTHRKDFHEYKMYVPFVKEEGTNTIYNTTVQLFSFWVIREVVVPPVFSFSYNDVSQTYDISSDDYESNYTIYSIAISGVLRGGKPSSKFADELETNKRLTDASNRIIELFKIPKNEAYANHLFICIPNILLDEFAFAPTHLNNPLIVYAREAIKAVYLDSVLSLQTVYGKYVNFGDFFYSNHLPISKLYPLIKSSTGIHDDEPMLVINNLCRAIRTKDNNHAPHFVNSNENVDPRGYMHSWSTKPRRLHELKRRVYFPLMTELEYEVNKNNYYYDESIDEILARLSNSKKHEILAQLVKKHKITHIMYSTYPAWTEEYISFITGIDTTTWHAYLSALPTSKFAAP